VLTGGRAARCVTHALDNDFVVGDAVEDQVRDKG
jgi:hypothetical protein